ncbi:MAG: tRNA (5-methylaminomethyl-2-thiouridine)(34)-methyltransferase MnmD [Sphingobacteriales bacterium]|nr:tRNA (5-methylaminomethyl-2-thiouridine)(34)-methyltransferase MnmD [Sphingobacteriales bacterium]
MEPKLVITKDGSSSLFIAELDEHYHSVHGAIQESVHVFINAGLKQKLSQQPVIQILEIGFGTGLNALLTCIEAVYEKSFINYTTIEKYPLNPTLVKELNYCALLQSDNCSEIFSAIHSANWGELIPVTDSFAIKKCKMDFKDIAFSNQFDIIYFDAFAPSAQPELWTDCIFASMFEALKPDGILVTYCAKGVVKRTMKNAGFILETMPGPVGKREMTRAYKIKP